MYISVASSGHHSHGGVGKVAANDEQKINNMNGVSFASVQNRIDETNSNLKCKNNVLNDKMLKFN